MVKVWLKNKLLDVVGESIVDIKNDVKNHNDEDYLSW